MRSAGSGIVRKNALLLVVLLFAQLLIMTGNARRADGATQLESWTISLTSPFVSISEGFGGGIRGIWEGLADLVGAHGRNSALEIQTQQLRAELRRAREAELENDRLRQLLQMRDSLSPRSIGASVIGSRNTSTEKMLILDRGESDGVLPDQAVVAWGGAVGRVVEVGRSHAKVRLLTDPNSGIAGVIQRTRAQGMVQGTGGETLDFLYVSRLDDVIYGDRAVASGSVGIFPRGFGIGRIVNIDEQADGSRRIKLRPEIDYRELEEVLILLEPIAGESLLPPGLSDEP